MDTFCVDISNPCIEGVEPLVTEETTLGPFTVAIVTPTEENAQLSYFLQRINCDWILKQHRPPSFAKHHVVPLLPGDIIHHDAIRTEARLLLDQLESPLGTETSHTVSLGATEEPLHSSLFSLARFIHQNKRVAPSKHTTVEKTVPESSRTSSTPHVTAKLSPFEQEAFVRSKHYRIEREAQHQGGGGQQQDKEPSHKEKHRTKKIAVTRTQVTADNVPSAPTEPTPMDINNLFVRFMALMSRILGQAEAEAHELYQKIKSRTDQIDLLTTLIQKINTENKGIDWTQKPDMIKLVEQARAMGVEVPNGKTKWTEEEKRLFKENIQMRKDSMEKITQLERTDMQRYLQEASQCHQARSNVLKLLKEVLDAIIHNIRP